MLTMRSTFLVLVLIVNAMGGPVAKRNALEATASAETDAINDTSNRNLYPTEKAFEEVEIEPILVEPTPTLELIKAKTEMLEGSANAVPSDVCLGLGDVGFLGRESNEVANYTEYDEFHFSWERPASLRTTDKPVIKFCVTSFPFKNDEVEQTRQCARTNRDSTHVRVYVPKDTVQCRRHFAVQYLVNGCGPVEETRTILGMVGRKAPGICHEKGSQPLPFYQLLTTWD